MHIDMDGIRKNFVKNSIDLANIPFDMIRDFFYTFFAMGCLPFLFTICVSEDR